MKIASFNANGIRARMPILLAWLDQVRPDVLALQETKVQDHDFPREPLEQAGYRCSFKGQKSYNGVAILSRRPPEDVTVGFRDGDAAEEPRLITATINGVTIVNTYIPQGQAVGSEKFVYKLEWYRRLRAYFDDHFRPTDPLVWLGDFNVAPRALDVYDPQKLAGHVCFHPEEHAALAQVMNWGFVDLYRQHNPEEQAFTFFDYRIPNAVKRKLGWRIDHICATLSLAAFAVPRASQPASRHGRTGRCGQWSHYEPLPAPGRPDR